MGSRDIAGMVNTYIRGNLLLLKFYLQSIAKVHSLPKWMRNPDTLKEVVNAKIENGELEHFTLTLPNNTAKEYNDGLENMKGEMRKLHAGEKEMFSYKTTLLLLFLLRFLCIVTAWYGNVVGTLAISSAQFLIAPYSLFVSFTLSLALAPPIYLCHYLSFYIIQSLLSLLTLVTPPLLLDLASYLSPYLYLPIGPVFICLFFICDQAICLYCHLCTPSRKFTVRETMIHAMWGFLNTKTYTIVILLHMMNAGVCIPVVIWLLDWWLGLTLKLSDIISDFGAHWAEHSTPNTGWLTFPRFMSMLTSFIIIFMVLLLLMLISTVTECPKNGSFFLLSFYLVLHSVLYQPLLTDLSFSTVWTISLGTHRNQRTLVGTTFMQIIICYM